MLAALVVYQDRIHSINGVQDSEKQSRDTWNRIILKRQYGTALEKTIFEENEDTLRSNT